MRSARLLACLLVLAAACNMREPGGGSGGEPSGPSRPFVGLPPSLETFASPLVVSVGEEVTAWCVATRGGALIAGLETEVVVEPDPDHLVEAAGAWTFTPTSRGEYWVRCRSTDGTAVDLKGVHVTVEPAPPAAIETTLSTPSAQTGEPVQVTCEIYDSFGARLMDVRADGLEVDPSMEVMPRTGAGFTVYGRAIGEFDVACRLGELVDDTPEVLTVTPGIPAITETTTDTTEARAAEVVSVACDVRDAFSTTLPGAQTEVHVLAGDGSTAEEAGLVIDGHTFSATRPGTYYVFCAVPGYPAGDETPVAVTVSSGYPCTWVATAIVTDCMWQGTRVPFDFEVYDFWGNVVEDAAVTVSAVWVRGTVGATFDGVRMTSDSESEWLLSVEVTGGGGPDPACAELTGSVTEAFVESLMFDSTGPTFTLSPGRASMLAQGTLADMSLPVTGVADDILSPIIALTVGGADLAPAGSNTHESVSVNMLSRWGLNVITGRAGDACGNSTVLAQSYLRGSATNGYFSAAVGPSIAARAPQGIMAQLNQPVIDDGNRSDTDDLATIAEVMLRAQDFNALIAPATVLASDPLRSGCSWPDWWDDTSYTVRRDDNAARRISVSGPYVISLVAVAGGLQAIVRIDQFDFPLEAEAYYRTCTLGGQTTTPTGWISGWAGADRVDATAVLSVALSGGAPSVAVSSISVSASGMYLSIDCGILGFVCDAITGLVMPLLESTIENALADAIRDQVPPLVEEALAGFALDTGFDLPQPISDPPPAAPMRVSISSALDRIVFAGPAGSGYGQLGLYAQVYPSSSGAIPSIRGGETVPKEVRGAIRKNGALPSFSPSGYTFGMALKDDLLNQILWAVWYGGGLDMDADKLASLMGGSGYAGISMSLYASLPPVLVTHGTSGQVDIGLGDVFIDASVDLGSLLGVTGAPPLELGIFLSAMGHGCLGIAEDTGTSPPTPTLFLGGLNTLSQCDPTVPLAVEVWSQVAEINDRGYQAVMSDVFDDVLAQLVPQLLSGVFTSFPIPDIDLTSVIGTPTVWRLQDATLDRTDAYFRVTGSLD